VWVWCGVSRGKAEVRGEVEWGESGVGGGV